MGKSEGGYYTVLFNYIEVNQNTTVIISLAIMLLVGFLITRITKKFKLPNVTAYILAGILIGPYVLDLIPADIMVGMNFITDVALAFIAFGVGRFLKFSALRGNRKQVLIVTLFESLLAAAIITLTMLYVFKLPLAFSLILGAIASATAPASTMMTIRQYKAKGPFVNMLLQVVALDDVVALIAFSVCAAVAQALTHSGSVNIGVFLLPILYNAIAIGIGVSFGFILHKSVHSPTRTKDNRLILAIAMILIVTGFCAAFDISPLLACMALGMTYVNISEDKKLFDQISSFAPPVFTVFFVLSGMSLDLRALYTAGVIGVVYFFIRIVGKYVGAYVGSAIAGTSPEIRNYLGMALVPQAGVSIGLAFLGQRILPAEMGSLLMTIILSSGVLYEMVGPVSAKAALFLSGDIPDQESKGKKAEKVEKTDKIKRIEIAKKKGINIDGLQTSRVSSSRARR